MNREQLETLEKEVKDFLLEEKIDHYEINIKSGIVKSLWVKFEVDYISQPQICLTLEHIGKVRQVLTDKFIQTKAIYRSKVVIN